MVTIFPLYLPAGARFLAFLPVLEYRNDISSPIPLFASPCLLFPFLLPDTRLMFLQEPILIVILH